MARSAGVVSSSAGVGKPPRSASACQSSSGVVPGRQQVAPLRVGRGQQVVPAPRACEPELLAPGHGPEREVARAAGQRLRHLPHQEQIGRAGEQEAPGPAVAVDGPLHRSQQVRLALDLVERERIVASQQGLGVAARRIAHVEVVQRAVAPVARNELFDQRALAGLACTGEHHGRHHAQPRGERVIHQTGQGLHDMDDIHSRRGLASPWGGTKGFVQAVLARLPSALAAASSTAAHLLSGKLNQLEHHVAARTDAGLMR